MTSRAQLSSIAASIMAPAALAIASPMPDAAPATKATSFSNGWLMSKLPRNNLWTELYAPQSSQLVASNRMPLEMRFINEGLRNMRRVKPGALNENER